MKLNFTKMQGCGNDFVMLNGFTVPTERLDLAALALQLCDRHFGIGADGLIILTPSDTADFNMAIYNNDGTQAQMCGNGMRCAAVFARNQGICQKEKFAVQTLAGLIYPSLSGDLVSVDMGLPRAVTVTGCSAAAPTDLIELPISTTNGSYTGYAVNMGNPHCVIFIAEPLAEFDVQGVGRQIELNPLFPEKTNVEFIRLLDAHTLDMRVWERGCGETLACGTGACAAGVAAIRSGRAQTPLTIHLLGGSLQINYQAGGSVLMQGPAEVAFCGTVEAD